MTARKACLACGEKDATIQRLLGIVEALTAKPQSRVVPMAKPAEPDPDTLAVRRAEQAAAEAHLAELTEAFSAAYGIPKDQAAAEVAKLRAQALGPDVPTPLG